MFLLLHFKTGNSRQSACTPYLIMFWASKWNWLNLSPSLFVCLFLFAYTTIVCPPAFLSFFLSISCSHYRHLSLLCFVFWTVGHSFHFNSILSFFSKRFSSRCSSQMKTLNLTVCQWKPFEKLKSWKAENPPVRSVFIFCKVLIIFIQIFCFKLKGNFCCLNIRKI